MNTSQQQNANNGPAKAAAPIQSPVPVDNAQNNSGSAGTTEPNAPVEKVVHKMAPPDATQNQTIQPMEKKAVEPTLQAAKGNDELMSQEQKKS